MVKLIEAVSLIKPGMGTKNQYYPPNAVIVKQQESRTFYTSGHVDLSWWPDLHFLLFPDTSKYILARFVPVGME